MKELKNVMLYDKKALIDIINNIDDIFIYEIKGGVSKFMKDYPNLLNSINYYSKDLYDGYVVNRRLIPKLIYLKKYNGDISKIKNNGVLKIYDKNIKDFKISNINVAKKQWKNINEKLDKIKILYSENETREKLKHNYKKYFGKLGNRKLMKDDITLYKSLYLHTKEFDKLNSNLNKLSFRLHFFVKKINIMCEKHNKLKHWTMKNDKIRIVCSKCESKYPTKEWFIKKYGNNWHSMYNRRREKLKILKTNSKKWFELKYGKKNGELKYKIYVEKKIKNLTNLKKNRYSKISQILFWKIYYDLEDKNNIYFHELNNEYVIRIPNKYKYEKTVVIVDFIKGKKIIEYNGLYWHSTIKDKLRYQILNDMGYEVLVIDSNEYNKNKKNIKTIKKCIQYLTQS